MKKQLLFFALSTVLAHSASASDKTLTLFHDSTDNSYYDQSWVNQTLPSKVVVAEGLSDKLPVSTNLYQGGSNALRLSWQSSPGGQWMALVAGIDWPAYRMENVTRLTFWAYTPESMDAGALPDINMEGHFGGQCTKLKLSDYVQTVPCAEWFKVSIPMKDFYQASPGYDAFNCIKGVFFHQSAEDGVEHTLYIDEVNFENLTTDVTFNNSKLSGYWTFDDKNQPFATLQGNATITPSGNCLWVQGVNETDGAIDIKTGVDNYLRVNHDIAPNGSSGRALRVNDYAMMFDVCFYDLSDCRSFYQSNSQNEGDGSFFVWGDGHVGLGGSVGYSEDGLIQENKWTRVVLNVRLGKDDGCFYEMYINGKKVFSGEKVAADNKDMSLEQAVLLFADNNEENGGTLVSRYALFNTWLTEDEISDLGGFPIIRRTEMLPYLQAPTPTSIVVNWHTLEKNSVPRVIYGMNPDQLNQTVTGSNEVIVDHIWNTVKLTGLQPDTEYFYQCISGEYKSEVSAFRTYKSGKGHKVRLILASDSQDNDAVTTDLVNRFTALLKKKYGDDLHNHINIMCHMGDAVSGGGVIEQYENRYYRPFSPLTRSIPVAMVSGNHDVEHEIFYKYAKYDDFANGVDGVNQEAFYTLKVNGVQLFMLNTNEGVRVQSQLDWLERGLKQAQEDDDVSFALGCCHHVYYSELWPGGSGAGLTEDSYQGTPYVGKLLQRLQSCPKVPALINGHVHAYERHVLPGQCAGGRDFLEVTVGGAGGNLDRWKGGSVGPDIYESKVALDQYHFVVIEMDVDNMTFEGTMYSFGNPDRPLGGVVCDTFYGKLNQDAPEQPSVIDFTPATVTVSDYAGVDELMTVQVQVAADATFAQPLMDKKYDKVNIYETDDEFVPINQNAGIDLKHIDITEAGLEDVSNLYTRVRYRDNNLKWSEWSQPFSPLTSGSPDIEGYAAVQVSQQDDALHVSLGDIKESVITLYNTLAQPVYSVELAEGHNGSLCIPVGEMPPGVYVLRVMADKSSCQVKVLLNS